MIDEWVVLLEATSTYGDRLALEDVLALLKELDPTASGLYSPERYAVQLRVDAPDRSEALNLALRCWAQSLERLALPEWEVARAEVLTVAEHDRELREGVKPGVVGGSDALPASPGDTLADELLQRAFCDPLTGLGTWETFATRVECALGAASVGQTHAMLFLEIDGFDELLRRCGRAAGDTVLQGVTHRLVSNVRTTDTMARIGDGGFALFMAHTCQTAVEAIRMRVPAILETPFVIDGETFTLTASIGIAVRRPDDGAAGLFEQAGMALAAAKRGRSDGSSESSAAQPRTYGTGTAASRASQPTAYCGYRAQSHSGERRPSKKREL